MTLPKQVLVLGTLFLIIFSSTTNVQAWGYSVHKEVASQAVGLLPEKWIQILNDNIETLKTGSILPDQWKDTDPYEGPRHYDDSDIPHKDINVSKDDPDYELGVVSWAVLNATNKLTDLITQGASIQTIVEQFGVITHYTADATQPLHATSNFDGQKTGNSGIHSRFESLLIDKYWDQIFLNFTFSKLEVVDPYNVTKDNIATGLANVQAILDADTEARATATSQDEYFSILFERVGTLAQQRIELAIQTTANLWYTALYNAGEIVTQEASSETPTSTTSSNTPQIIPTTATPQTSDAPILGIALVIFSLIPVMLMKKAGKYNK